MSRITGRQDQRKNRKFKVWLSRGNEPMFAELASTENVSSCGVRVRTELPWKANTCVFVKLSKGKEWTRARIAYCQRLEGKNHALGLEFYETAHRYNLTFRCIHCGRYEASANFRSDHVESANEIRARIYRVQCSGCGWRGEACGLSTVRILRYKSAETRSSEGSPMLVRLAGNTTRMGSEKELSRGAA